TRSGKLANGKSLDGSDLKRIDRQQQLIATVINEVLSSGSIKSLPKLNSVATAVTSALFVSPELGSVGAMAGMAYALRNIELANVSLFTAPVVDAGQRVRLAEWGQGNKFGGASAKEVFDYLALDQPVPGTTPYKLLHPEPETPADPTTSTSGNVPAPTPDVSADEGIITAVDTPVTEAACQVAGQGMD
ncbi:MAG: LCP family protein, partial [Bifidobacteriaceae bacterium]|nr:LCP family protein [Bifidobacteriaceae bacterium]